MNHKIFTKLLLLICLVVSCSEVPHTQQLNPVEPIEPANESVDLSSITEGFDVDKSFSGATNEQRAIFLQAEQALLRRDNATFLTQIEQLKGYPLYSYLQAQWLRKNLNKRAEIELLLNSYKNNRYVESLRQDWLYFLAKNQQWQLFSQYYQTGDDANKAALQCYFAQTQYSAGQTEAAFTLAKELWLKGVTQPACNSIFAAFKQSASFTEELFWQRFSATLRGKKPNPQLAVQLKQQMPLEVQKTADLWLKVYAQPSLISKPNQWDSQNPKAGEIFAQGIERLASSNLSNAIALWDAQKGDFTIRSETADFINQTLGLALINAGYPFYAHARLMQASYLDETARQALFRAALREQNWVHINEALSKLTAEEKTHDKWRYWQARAAMELGKPEEARKTYAELAKKSNFYAFLSADRLKQTYQFVNIPVPVTQKEFNALKENDDFKIIAEWLALGRKEEALKQWWYVVKKSSPKQIMAAAKLAQHWKMLKLAAFTIAKAEYWHDLELRFPIRYPQEINTHASNQALDPAIVFGLIRQESVFDERAGSQVGARGLMQIMPATGRQIAKQLQESWRSDTSLYEPETNIKYGTFYYKQLLNRFNGQVALAAAGYNAGPGRVKKWSPNQTMPMDIWIETIPFNETRHYVMMVLSNALFYQYRTHRDVLKMADFMNDVQPSLVRDSQISGNNQDSSGSVTQ